MEKEIDEISLREIIETVWKGKWIIILVTAIAVATSGIVSFLIMDPVYEARSTIMISNEKKAEESSQSMQTYFEQVKNHMIMTRTIDQLGLHQQKITVTALRDKIDAGIVKDTNLMRITVRDNDPKLASDIANAVTLHFADFMSNQSLEQLKLSAEYMIDQIDTELNINQAALKKVGEELAGTPEILVTNKSLSDDAFLHSVVSQDGDQPSSETGGLQMRSEETNPVYISLKQSASNLNVEISKLENKRNDIEEKIKNNELINQESIMVVSRAIEPEKPVGPKKMLNVAIAGVVGGMISLFIVFLMAYWRNSATDSTVNRRTNENNADISV